MQVLLEDAVFNLMPSEGGLNGEMVNRKSVG